MRSVHGDLAAKLAGLKVVEEQQMQSGCAKVAVQGPLGPVATPRLKLRPLEPELRDQALELTPLNLKPLPVVPCLAEPLQCVGAQLG